MNCISRFLNIINPFNIHEVISNVLEESAQIKRQLIELEYLFSNMSTLIEDYEDKLEKAEQEIVKIHTEKIHILETIKIQLENSCSECKEGPVKTVIEYCNEIIKEVKNGREE